MTHDEGPTLETTSFSGGGGNDPLVGRRIGEYRVLSLLGEGGFGSVYLAEQAEPVRRRVALKVVRPGMDTRALLARFDAERQALALMDHPGLARVYDAGMTPEGRPYFAMELVRGEPIDRFCAGARLGVEDRAELIVQVAEAVHHAHMKGIVHRDLKPSNILVEVVDRRPVVRVIDFGVAKAINQPLSERTVFTEHGQMIGTPEYMAPEQARGDVLDVDTRADVYSIGAIFYQLLTGETPIESARLREGGPAQVATLIEHVEPPRPSERVRRTTTAPGRSVDGRRLRGDLDWIVMRCLEKDRAMRYDSASALAADIERFLRDEPVEAGPPSATYRLHKFVRRHRALVVGASCVALAVVLGLAGTGAGLQWALRERERAQAAEAAAVQRETEAIAAREEAEAVTRFLIGAIESVDPDEGRRDVTMAEVLEGMGRRAEPAFAGAPGLEATVRHTLGLAHWALGDLHAAEEHLSRARALRAATLGPDHVDTVRTTGNLSGLRHEQGRYAEAERLAAEALAWHDAQGGAPTREHVGLMNNLAQLYEATGRDAEALAMQQRAVEAMQAALGEDHADTLGAGANLATMLAARGDVAGAEAILRETALAAETGFGAEHPLTLLMHHKLGLLLSDTGRLAEAVAVQRGVLERRRRVLGALHPETIGSAVNLALSLRQMGAVEEALVLQTEALSEGRRALGDLHPTTIAAAYGLLETWETLGWPDESGERVAELLAVFRSMAARADATASDLNATAWTLLTVRPERLRDVGEALRCARRACETERASGGGQLWQYLDTLALALHESGDYAGAVEAQREAVALLPAQWEKYRGEMSERLAAFERAAAGGG